MTFSVNKIKETSTRYDGKTHNNYVYCLTGTLPTWDGDEVKVNLNITSNKRLEIQEDHLLELRKTGTQERLITDEEEKTD